MYVEGAGRLFSDGSMGNRRVVVKIDDDVFENLIAKKILKYSILCGTLGFAMGVGVSHYAITRIVNNEIISSNNDLDENSAIYEIGEHSVVTKSTKEELTNIVNNIPIGYDLEKIEKLENNEYDVYFINNTKVVVTEDNQFGIEIEDAKVKTK